MVLKEDFYRKTVFSKKESDFMQDSQKYTGFSSQRCAEWIRMDHPSCPQVFSFFTCGRVVFWDKLWVFFGKEPGDTSCLRALIWLIWGFAVFVSFCVVGDRFHFLFEFTYKSFLFFASSTLQEFWNDFIIGSSSFVAYVKTFMPFFLIRLRSYLSFFRHPICFLLLPVNY